MRNTNISLMLQSLHQRPISYYPLYTSLTGTLAGGVLLSQLMYWFSVQESFYKTDKELMSETKLTHAQLRKAKERIKDIEFLILTREGMPAKTIYNINWDSYIEIVHEHLDNIQEIDSIDIIKPSKPRSLRVKPSGLKKKKRILSNAGLFPVNEDITIDSEDKPILDFVLKYNEKVIEDSPHVLNSSQNTTKYILRCVSVVKNIIDIDSISLDELTTLLEWAKASSFWSSQVNKLTVIRNKAKVSGITKIGSIKEQYKSAKKSTKKGGSSYDVTITNLYLSDVTTFGEEQAAKNRAIRKKLKKKGEPFKDIT